MGFPFFCASSSKLSFSFSLSVAADSRNARFKSSSPRNAVAEQNIHVGYPMILTVLVAWPCLRLRSVILVSITFWSWLKTLRISAIRPSFFWSRKTRMFFSRSTICEWVSGSQVPYSCQNAFGVTL